MATHSSPSLQGVVFDLDGVLIDSHDQHEASWFLLAEEIGKPLTISQFKESFGMRNASCIPHVFRWADPDDEQTIHQLGERKEELYRELLAKNPMTPLPGVLSLLESLRDAEIPVSLGSSTSRKNIEVCFASTGLGQFFGPHYTGAEDVANGKPDPEVFLKAVASIGAQPKACVVIEDAHVGVEAALAGGMLVVAVTTTHPRDSFAGSGTSRVVASLAELDAEALRRLWG